jgi:lactoylglutathione lyase
MKFGYTIVYVDSVSDTLAFYKAAFGFDTRFLHESGEYGELETGATALAFASHNLGQMNLDGQYQKSDLSQKPLGVEIAFVTDDVHASFDKAVKAGAVALTEPKLKPWGQTVAYVRSIEGSLIELCSPVAS